LQKRGIRAIAEPADFFADTGSLLPYKKEYAPVTTRQKGAGFIG